MVLLDKRGYMRSLKNINIELSELIENYGGIISCEFEGEESLFEFFGRGDYPIDLNEEISSTLGIDTFDLDINENTRIKEIWDVLLEQ